MSKEVHSAYTARQRGEETIRETEAHALLSCANRLEAAREDSCSQQEFFDALRHNQQLWTLFQSCLCEADNPLPRDLKGLLLNLSVYVDKVTFRALAESNKNLLRSLININRNIAAGLRKTPPKEETATQVVPPPEQQPANIQLMTSA